MKAGLLFSSAAAADDLLEKLNAVVADLAEAKRQWKRCRALLPDFARWAAGQYCSPTFAIVDKTFDAGRTRGEDIADAVKRGALTNLHPPRAPVVDPSAKVGEVELHHRFNQRENP